MGHHPRAGLWTGLLCGLVFGLGLGVSQMVDPRKVLGFLDIAGGWDPSLMLVMGGALAVAAIGFRVVLRRPAPRFGERFHLSTQRAIDAPLLGGAALFGIGWGLVGYCPGPAIASLGFGNAEALWFLPAMVAGAGLQRWQARRGGTALAQTRHWS
jgi:uncharacterized membrane protein YedE/YeeE